jgi:steroid 5-alpha reductase family enzyme
MPLWVLPLVGWAAMSLAMLLAWAYAQRRRDAGVVDAVWALGVGGLAVFYAAVADGPLVRRVLLAALAGMWSGRLGLYLLRDRVLGAEEDGRYQMLRSRWGPHAGAFFFVFFQIQAIGAVLFSLPFLPVVAHRSPLPAWHDFVGVAIWLLAVGGEGLADLQLARFRRRPGSRGHTCREGLWRYSRHPNYFFEWVHWFSYILLAWGAPYAWLAWLGPVVMLFFLFKVTGIPYTEKRAVASRGADYRQYQRTTSIFIPWPPKEP